jgi:hypothetical protein
MVFETIYMLREVAKSATHSEVRIPIRSLKDAIFKELLEEDGIAIYPSETEFYEDLKTLQKQSFITIDGGQIAINRDVFLRMTKFVERQEEMLRDDRYAVALFEKLKQRAQRIPPA